MKNRLQRRIIAGMTAILIVSVLANILLSTRLVLTTLFPGTVPGPKKELARVMENSTFIETPEITRLGLVRPELIELHSERLQDRLSQLSEDTDLQNSLLSIWGKTNIRQKNDWEDLISAAQNKIKEVSNEEAMQCRENLQAMKEGCDEENGSRRKNACLVALKKATRDCAEQKISSGEIRQIRNSLQRLAEAELISLFEDRETGEIKVSNPGLSIDEENMTVQTLGTEYQVKIPMSAQDTVRVSLGERGAIEYFPFFAANQLGTIVENKILYGEVWPGVDLMYTTLPEGVKEDLIIKNEQAEKEFLYVIQADDLSLESNEDGSVQYLDKNGMPQLYIPAPIIYDAAGEEYPAKMMLLSRTEAEDWLNENNPLKKTNASLQYNEETETWEEKEFAKIEIEEGAIFVEEEEEEVEIPVDITDEESEEEFGSGEIVINNGTGGLVIQGSGGDIGAGSGADTVSEPDTATGSTIENEEITGSGSDVDETIEISAEEVSASGSELDIEINPGVEENDTEMGAATGGTAELSAANLKRNGNNGPGWWERIRTSLFQFDDWSWIGANIGHWNIFRIAMGEPVEINTGESVIASDDHDEESAGENTESETSVETATGEEAVASGSGDMAEDSGNEETEESITETGSGQTATGTGSISDEDVAGEETTDSETGENEPVNQDNQDEIMRETPEEQYVLYEPKLEKMEAGTGDIFFLLLSIPEDTRSRVVYPLDLDPTIYVVGWNSNTTENILGYGWAEEGGWLSLNSRGNPVGYWPMDNNFHDLSRNGNDGVAKNGVGFGTGKISLAGSFDGTNDYVEIENNNVFSTTGGSIMAWVEGGGSNGVLLSTVAEVSDESADLVGLWHMNNSWNDATSSGNDGTAQGGATFTAKTRLGTHAGSFDGDNDYIDFGDVDDLELSAFTVSAWFKLNSTNTGYQTILTKGSMEGDRSGYAIRVNGDHLEGYLTENGGGIKYISGATVIVADKWYQATLTAASGTMELFLNSISQGTESYADPIDYSGGGKESFYIGAGLPATGTYDTPLDGDIDEAAVFQKRMWATEVRARYLGGISANIISNKLTIGIGDTVMSDDTSLWVPGEWHHIAGTYSTEEAEAVMYIDGVVVDTGSFVSMQNIGTGTYVGSNYMASAIASWEGYLDEFLVYNQALSAEEIAKLAQVENYYGLVLNEDFLSGYAWLETLGYAHFGSGSMGPYPEAGAQSASEYGVNVSTESNDKLCLSGYAWGEKAGWIGFGSGNVLIGENDPMLGIPYCDPSVLASTGSTAYIGADGVIHGYAWGERAGWINMNGRDAVVFREVIETDNTGPSSGSIDIPTLTKDPTPNLVLSAEDDGAGMGEGSLMVFGCDDSNWTETTAYATNYDGFDIRDGSGGCVATDGLRTVRVKFSDRIGNWSTSFSDTTTLDMTAPEIKLNLSGDYFGPQTFISGSTLSGTASDATTSVDSVEISLRREDGGTDSYWTGTGWASTGEIWLSADGTENWSYAIDEGDLTDGKQYEIQARASDELVNITIPYATGAFVYDSSPPSVTGSTLITPNGGEVWGGNTERYIVWNTGSIADDYLVANPIKLEYSSNGSGWILIDDNLPNIGSHLWITPDIDSSTVRVRLTAIDMAGNEAMDISDGDFTIAPTGNWQIIEIVSGNRQRGGIEEALDDDLTVRVSNSFGSYAGEGEVTVLFEITEVPDMPDAQNQKLESGSHGQNHTSSGNSIMTVETENDGYASVKLKLGDRAGDYAVTAYFSGCITTEADRTFDAWEREIFQITIGGSNPVLRTNPSALDMDTSPIVLTLASNAASYEIAVTPESWLNRVTATIGNWTGFTGFGWDNNDSHPGTTSWDSSGDDPATTTVYSCTGDNCQGILAPVIDLTLVTDYVNSAGSYSSNLRFEGVNIVF